MTNRSRRRFLTSALATTSLGMLSGCSDILGSIETNTPETSSKAPDSTTAVTETIATTVETVTATTRSPTSESSENTAAEPSSKKTQQDETTTSEPSSTSNSQATEQTTSAESTTSTITAYVPVEKPTTTSEDTMSVESALEWLIDSLQSEGVNASNPTTWRDIAKITHTTKETTLLDGLAGEIGTVAGHWVQFTTKVENPPSELRVTLQDKDGDDIGGYSVMTKDADAVLDGFMTTNEFSRRIVSTIRFSPGVPTTMTTRAPSTTMTTTTTATTPPESTTTSSQTTYEPPTTTTESRYTTTRQTSSSRTTTTTETSKSTTTATAREAHTTKSSR
ncbi:hypothetical protein [Haladaptatus caseinilyticus]|uniref:hypothetical protein n=1 Tax=Haladaptatus caseinilyticus TaxID=2993314 RepID=UPI00224B603B|nr:hypothetical protein [Haladaptatus caseinilyticus]